MRLDEVLPAGAVGAESWAPWAAITLAPAEAELVAGAGERRRAEFAAGRDCARRALRRLGRVEDDLVIGRHDDGAPAWPTGVVGSITHTGRYAAAAVAHRADLLAIGVDAEPAEPLPVGIAELVCSPEELAWACAREGPPWDRLLFSAKESVVKALASVDGRMADLSEVEVVVDPARGTLSARIVGGSESGRQLQGRFAWSGDLLLTAVGIPAR